MQVLPVGPAQFDEIYPLLLEFHDPRMSREDWRRMLFDLAWPVEEPHRGYVLRDGGVPVGFLGTLFSRRRCGGEILRFCNLSSWIVKESHRAASLQLVLPVLALRSHTIVNLSPSATAYEVFKALGFQPLESAQVLLPPLPRPGELRRSGAGFLTDPEAVRAALDPEGREIQEHMARTRAGQTLLRERGRACHVVATRSPWKGSWRLAHVQYASDWGMLLERPGLASAALRRVLGTVGLRIDARHLRGPRPALSVLRALPRPNLFRPASADITPERVDGLYTELVGQRW